jgi:hypothetical protein
LESYAHETSGGAMEWLLKQLAEHASLSMEMVGILVVTVGSVEAVLAAGRMMFTRGSDTARREGWLKYARWLNSRG